jgi:hypothetical protein
MESEFTPEMIIGVIAAFGIAQIIILTTLKKLGIIHFNNKTVVPIKPINHKCDDHDNFYKSFVELRDFCIGCKPIVEQHGKELDEGKSIFSEIKDVVVEIRLDLERIKQKLEIPGEL